MTKYTKYSIALFPKTASLSTTKIERYERKFEKLVRSFCGKNGYKEFSVRFTEDVWKILFKSSTDHECVLRLIRQLKINTYIILEYSFEPEEQDA